MTSSFRYPPSLPRWLLLWVVTASLHLARGDEAVDDAPSQAPTTHPTQPHPVEQFMEVERWALWVGLPALVIFSIPFVASKKFRQKVFAYCDDTTSPGQESTDIEAGPQPPDSNKNPNDVEEGQQQEQEREHILQQIAAIREQIELSATEEEKAVFERSLKMELGKLEKLGDPKHAAQEQPPKANRHENNGFENGKPPIEGGGPTSGGILHRLTGRLPQN